MKGPFESIAPSLMDMHKVKRVEFGILNPDEIVYIYIYICI